MNAYSFAVTGDFDVHAEFKEVRNIHDEIIGFERPDGSIVRLVVGLEIEEEGKYSPIVGEQKLEAAGFSNLIYCDASFVREQTDGRE